MKRLLLLFAVMIGFGGVASAQFSYNERQLYIEVGESVDNDQTLVYVIETINGDYRIFEAKVSEIKFKMRHERYQYTTDDIWTPGIRLGITEYPGRGYCKYDSSLSTSKYNTYKSINISEREVPVHFSISSDKKSMIFWRRSPSDRKYCRLLDPSEFEPKPVNIDFLYE